MQFLKIIVFAILCQGCSTPKTFITDTPAKINEDLIKKSFLFEQDKEATWNNLLTTLANTDFRIDKINMHGYLVKVYLTGQPDVFIDCGRKNISTDGNEINIINAQKRYSYSAYQYIHLETYSIENSFTGYATLFVTGNELSSQISVQYDLELETKEDRKTTRGTRYGSNRTEKLTLNSNQPVYSKLFNAECRSINELEFQVMNTISKMHNFLD